MMGRFIADSRKRRCHSSTVFEGVSSGKRDRFSTFVEKVYGVRSNLKELTGSVLWNRIGSETS